MHDENIGVRLRPTVVSDLPVLYENQLDPEANAMAVVRPRDRESFEAHWARVLANPDCVARTIVDGGGRVLGGISCFEVSATRYIGYWVAREHWGKGVASSALALLLVEVPERPLHARAARTNVASIRVLERNGFVVTGYEQGIATERFLACEEAILVVGA